jgi:hypothetical protein
MLFRFCQWFVLETEFVKCLGTLLGCSFTKRSNAVFDEGFLCDVIG